MPVLKREIAKRIKGSLQETEDWWRLCYDTDAQKFFVEHEWSHVNAYRLSAPADYGTERMPVEGYRDHGAAKVEQAKAELLAEAGHAQGS